MRQASRRWRGAPLIERLRERRSEIEQATLLRVRAVSALPRAGGPEYAEGLRVAVCAGIGYGIEAIERGEQSAPPIPEALLAQARLAARSGVSLDTVLRRYFAGHVLLDDYLVEEAEQAKPLERAELKRLLRSQAAIADRLLAAVSEVYTEEAKRLPTGTRRRRAERVERLLAGEPLDASELSYELGAWHLGVVAEGPRAEERTSELAASLDCRLLGVPREEGVLWAWLGRRRRISREELEALTCAPQPAGHALALGEPGEGIAGWRLTHRQARAALPIAQRSQAGLARYEEVALVASMQCDDLLLISLHQLYLQPLATERDGGALARETLLAYFTAERSVTCAAASLGVSRQTVSRRLRAIEERIGRPLNRCATEVEAALRLSEHEPTP